MSNLKWNGPEVQSRIQAEMRRRVAACCILISNYAKQLVSVAGTGSAGGPGRNSKGQYRKRAKYGANPSAPGEPPRKQTGHLRRSITWEATDLVGRVGTNLLYGRRLELGTRLMKARPWLRRALEACRAEAIQILSRPMKGP